MTYQLSIKGTPVEKHVNLLQEAKNEFKILFVAEVKGFDSSDRYDDGLGTFYLGRIFG